MTTMTCAGACPCLGPDPCCDHDRCGFYHHDHDPCCRVYFDAVYLATCVIQGKIDMIRMDRGMISVGISSAFCPIQPASTL